MRGQGVDLAGREVGDPDRLLGILTPMDVLRYLYGVASPFVQLAEIEVGLRALPGHPLNKYLSAKGKAIKPFKP